ncbi:MAG TPA: hypothetical protein VIY72_01655 [Acidimicrobiales bacterium]
MAVLLGPGCGSMAASDDARGSIDTDPLDDAASTTVALPSPSSNIDDLTNFMATIPTFQVATFPPAGDLADLMQRADALVVGTITEVRLGEERLHSREQVVCEIDEGVPVPGECFVETRTVSLVWTIAVDEGHRKVVGSDTGDGPSVSVEMPFDGMPTPLEVSRARAGTLAAEAREVLVGHRVAVFLDASSSRPVPASNAAVSVVTNDGSLVPAPFYRGEQDRGIGEAGSLDELRARLTGTGEYAAA